MIFTKPYGLLLYHDIHYLNKYESTGKLFHTNVMVEAISAPNLLFSNNSSISGITTNPGYTITLSLLTAVILVVIRKKK